MKEPEQPPKEEEEPQKDTTPEVEPEKESVPVEEPTKEAEPEHKLEELPTSIMSSPDPDKEEEPA